MKNSINITDLTNSAMDWAIAQSNFKLIADPMSFGLNSTTGGYWIWEKCMFGEMLQVSTSFSPSTKITQILKLIEMKNCQITVKSPTEECDYWVATCDSDVEFKGDSMSAAISRAYLASIKDTVTLRIPVIYL